MGRRSHTRSVGLWMNGHFVGTWQMHPYQGDILNYDKDWVASSQGRALSLSLPFLPGGTPHRGERVRWYFENLLPDSREIRERIARRFKARTTDAFDLLEQVGRDCIGALQILPDGEAPGPIESVQAQPLSGAEVAQMLRAAVTPTIGTDSEADLRISIAGAQEKTALLLHQGKWCRPYGATPTTHIFKLPLGLVGNRRLNLSDSVENEWLCLQILKRYGMAVAHCELLQFEDQKALCVERFDRRWWEQGNRWVIRLPQEDMCQASGTPPHLKYESDGGPGIDEVLRILDGSQNRTEDRLQFFKAQVLFWMLGATDGHAKNFSLFLHGGGSYRLTPLYDVLSTYPVMGNGPSQISPYKARMAMAVRSKNAHWIMKDILRRHWVAAGQRHGIVSANGHGAEFILDELIASTPKVIQSIQSTLPADFPVQVAGPILTGLREAADRLAG